LTRQVTADTRNTMPTTSVNASKSYCPHCGRWTLLRVDGRPGRHFSSRGKHGRRRCPEGEPDAAPTHPRRRVTVTVNVLIPTAMTAHAYQTQAAAVLREHALSDGLLRPGDLAGLVVDDALVFPAPRPGSISVRRLCRVR
jgi:hypothetical protein